METKTLKAVIFAGGLGTRMREETDLKPKPMVEIGGRPVLWHLMKIYSQHGIRDFVILAGYRSEVIKSYFSELDLRTRDFTVSTGISNEISYLSGESEDWNISIVDTGEETLTGERLLKAKDVIGQDSFHCTYGDGLAPVNLAQLENAHSRSGKIATMTVTRPSNRFGVVEFDETGTVLAFREKPKMADWVNMGYFIFKPDIFLYLKNEEALEDGALHRLAGEGQMGVNQYDGFWEPMDTYREYKLLNALWNSESAPWKVW
jgi:glucose-1-phosphate cytidylyltransferase